MRLELRQGHTEDVGKREQPGFDQVLLTEMSEPSGLGAAEPARQDGTIGGMLRPPDRDRLLRKQKGQIGEFASREPPAGLETQQQLDDVSEADIRGRTDLLALGRRKRDVLQKGKRHRKNDRAASKAAAICAPNHYLTRGRLDCACHRAELNHNSMLSALRRQEIDQGAVAADNPRLRASSGAHPFLAKRQDTRPRRIGRVVTLNHALDRLSQPVVFATAEMPSEEFGDRHVLRQGLQRRMKLGRVGVFRRAAGQRSAFSGPSLSFDRLHREPRFAQQRVGDRRLAVNEFGAAFRGIPELRGRKRINAAAAPVARLQDRDPPAGGSKLARGHQACGARADHDDML